MEEKKVLVVGDENDDKTISEKMEEVNELKNVLESDNSLEIKPVEDVKADEPKPEQLAAWRRYARKLKSKIGWSLKTAINMKKQMRKEKHERYLERKNKIKAGNLKHERLMNHGK